MRQRHKAKNDMRYGKYMAKKYTHRYKLYILSGEYYQYNNITNKNGQTYTQQIETAFQVFLTMPILTAATSALLFTIENEYYFF